MLEGDHQRADQLHDQMERLFLAWIEGGQLDEGDSTALLETTAELDRIYQAHIKVEEELVFPEAARTLDEKTVEAIGREFRARRT